MIPILKSFSILTLAVFLISTALFPLAQAQAAEDIQVEPNMAEEPATLTPLLYGLWLTEVSEEYTDIHLWYKINPELTSATSIDGTTQTYDNNGNLTSDSTWNYVWDYNNRLVQATSTSEDITFAYDHSGNRVLMDDGDTTTVYANRYFNTDGEEHTKHIFAGDLLVATIEGTGPTTTISYIHTDHLTGSSVATNASSTVVQLLDYYPYGELRIDIGTFDEQRKFTGHEYDRDTGLNYMGARYYDAAIGRFLSQDPAFWGIVTGIADPQLVNSYAYARGNPLTYNDPDGQWPSLAQTNSFLARVDRYNPCSIPPPSGPKATLSPPSASMSTSFADT